MPSTFFSACFLLFTSVGMLTLSGCGEHKHTYAYGAPGEKSGSEEARFAWTGKLEAETPLILKASTQFGGWFARGLHPEREASDPSAWKRAKVYDRAISWSFDHKEQLPIKKSKDVFDYSASERRAILAGYLDDPETNVDLGEGYFRVRSCEH